MYHIRSNAEAAVRTLLRGVAARVGPVLEAVDWLDDGSPVRPLPLNPSIQPLTTNH